ncbi:MAG: hypothetical protein Q9187_001892 [Circinaria calcarea]
MELCDGVDLEPRRNMHRPHHTDDGLDVEEEFRPQRNTTRAGGAGRSTPGGGRSTPGGGNRRAHDTDNELDSEGYLHPNRTTTHPRSSRRPHDSDTEPGHDGRLRPARPTRAVGSSRAGSSTQPQVPRDAGTSTLKAAIRDHGYKGRVADEEEEPPAYEEVGKSSGKSSGKGRKVFTSGRMG